MEFDLGQLIAWMKMSVDGNIEGPEGYAFQSAFLGHAPARQEVVWMKIGSIVIHCHEFDRMVAFWQRALGYVPREPASDGWVVLRDPQGKGPNVSFQARERRPGRRSWLHLDLYTSDQKGEVERLLALGARRYPWKYRPGADFVVLEDPDGNLFCVVEKAETA